MPRVLNPIINVSKQIFKFILYYTLIFFIFSPCAFNSRVYFKDGKQKLCIMY